MLGFADFKLNQLEGSTHIVYDVYVEQRIPGVPPEQLRDFARNMEISTRAKLDAEHKVLKSLLERK